MPFLGLLASRKERERMPATRIGTRLREKCLERAEG
jgi:hypothetical protein